MSVDLVACPTCELDVPDGLSFCPQCRAKAEGRAFDPGEVDRHERAYVLSLVGLTLGALAIPRALKSRAFGPIGKLLLVMLGLGNTGGVVVIVYLLMTRWLPGWIDAARAAFGR